jgi:protein-L-isoaspartate(D-aspartate) O-methyltransferase
MLYLFRKVDGQLKKERLESTFFVPMTGRAEEKRIKLEDPKNPQIVNGSFEEVTEDGELPGWYYLMQAKSVVDDRAIEGSKVLVIENQTPGRNAHALQAIGLDGRVIHEVELTVHVQARLSQPTRDQRTWPRVELTFYDEDRAPIRTAILGPWGRETNWTKVRERIKIPGRARLAVLACAIFGASGQLIIDDARLNVVR